MFLSPHIYNLQPKLSPEFQIHISNWSYNSQTQRSETSTHNMSRTAPLLPFNPANSLFNTAFLISVYSTPSFQVLRSEALKSSLAPFSCIPTSNLLINIHFLTSSHQLQLYQHASSFKKSINSKIFLGHSTKKIKLLIKGILR